MGDCAVCSLAEAKYKCPTCEMATCSLECVRKHKTNTGCSGLRQVPQAPAAVPGSPAYTESLFVRDYNFLERVCDFASGYKLEEKRDGSDSKDLKRRGGSRSRALARIGHVARLSFLDALPAEFARARRNHTRLVKTSKGSTEGLVSQATAAADMEKDSAAPEMRSSKRQLVAWTVELIEFATELDLATDAGSSVRRRIVDNVLDSQLFSVLSVSFDVMASDVACFLLQDSRGTKKEWTVIPRERWNEPISRIFEGSRFIEFPTVAFVRRSAQQTEK